ncbi:unnamed protein product [Cylicocyclus nassatus]|uniref:Uncharacterized protein n=1 Tax=Cylicocyclus nassatus TaxID=53992 RepID=A0AA36MI09_CYLNA|nr:unnamed protein product [Cylicocyclus nassatus]
MEEDHKAHQVTAIIPSFSTYPMPLTITLTDKPSLESWGRHRPVGGLDQFMSVAIHKHPIPLLLIYMRSWVDPTLKPAFEAIVRIGIYGELVIREQTTAGNIAYGVQASGYQAAEEARRTKEVKIPN